MAKALLFLSLLPIMVQQGSLTEDELPEIMLAVGFLTNIGHSKRNSLIEIYWVISRLLCQQTE